MGGKSTTESSAEPWKAIQPNLKGIAKAGEKLYDKGGFAADPYSGDRLAGFGDASLASQNMIADMAGGPNYSNKAARSMVDLMRGKGNFDLSGVKQNALGSAIPAATAMFSGSGLADSSMAMDTVGRAATEAIAPIEYGAFQQQQQNALQAASMMPALDQARYMPAQMLQSVGTMQDLMSQAQIDSDMKAYYEGENQAMNNLQGYTNLLNPLATMGGSSSSTTTTSPGITDVLGMGLGILSLFSDRRTKENIVKIGERGDVDIYAFNYLWSPTLEIGVMADEVPHAICGEVGGYAVVDYARL